jgi:hypothetical protein
LVEHVLDLGRVKGDVQALVLDKRRLAQFRLRGGRMADCCRCGDAVPPAKVVENTWEEK